MPSTSASSAVSADPNLTSQVIGELPAWGRPHVTELMERIKSAETPFPCTFAVSAAKNSGLRFGFVEDLHDRRSWEVLPDLLSGYLQVYQQIARETSFVVVFRKEDSTRTVADYYRLFWEILQFLHERDPEPWPGDIPADPDEAAWEFSFGGTPIFVVCNTPAHVHRKSRANSAFVITFQPRWVFEKLHPGTPRGAAARRVIRNRLRAYDDVAPSPDLGNYGDSDNREWRQYFLPESNDPRAEKCPFTR